MNDDILLLAGLFEAKKIGKDESPSEFLKARREGAKKIATTAKSKGGPAMLTYYHFVVKDAEYRDVLQAIKSKKPESFYKNKYNSIMSELHQTKFEKESFQKVVGKLEVWGEAISVIF